MDLQLADADARVLIRRLSNDFSDLRAEIAGTDSQEWREELKEEEQALLRILNSLGVSLEELSQPGRFD